MASQLRVDEIIASTGSSVAIGTAGGSVTLAGDFTVDTSKGLNVGTGATIFSPSSNVLTLGTNSAERVRIDSSGKVTITSATNSGDAPSGGDNLVIKDSDGCGISVLSGDSNSANIFLGSQSDEDAVRLEGFYNSGSPYFTVSTNGSQRLRITSSGNVGIGTDNPGRLLNLYGATTPLVRLTHTTASSYAGLEVYEGTTQKAAFNALGSTSSATGGANAIQVWNFMNAPTVFGTNNTERLRITSDGDIRGSLLESGSGVSVYPEFYRRITGFTGGSSVVNYILLCTTSQPNVRLSGRLVTSRSPGTSAVSSQLFDVTFQTNHDGTHRSGAIMGLHSGSDGYDHAQAEFVSLTYDSTDYYAIRFSGGWTADLDSCYFDGIASDNVLFTHIDSANETITGVTAFTADTNKGDVTIQQADLRISDGNIIMASGHGIDFSPSGIEASGTITNTNQLLDDYEEGLWTPTLIGSTSGSASGYSHQKAGYVKIGNVVHVYGYLLISNKGTITGNVRISNFPFAAKNTSLYYHAPAFGWYTAMTGITAYGLGLDMAPGQTSHTIVYGSGTTVSSLAAGNINNNFGVEWAFTYRTD